MTKHRQPKPTFPQTASTLAHGRRRNSAHSETRRRDLRSGVKRVAALLGEDLAHPTRSVGDRRQARCGQPDRRGSDAEELANIRSDFLAAVKASGLKRSSRSRRPRPESGLE